MTVMYVAYPSRPATRAWLRISFMRLRKFVSDPFVDCLTTEVSLTWRDVQHIVDAACPMTVVEPFEGVCVVAKPPIDRPVTQLVHLLAWRALCAPLARMVSKRLAYGLRNENGHKSACFVTRARYLPHKNAREETTTHAITRHLHRTLIKLKR